MSSNSLRLPRWVEHCWTLAQVQPDSSTDGYEHVTAGDNLLAIDFLQQVGGWLFQRHDPNGASLIAFATKLKAAVNAKMWKDNVGWFVSLFPDGSEQLVWTYHEFDALGTKAVLSSQQVNALSKHIVSGEFLAPNGMFSISRVDMVHWDLEDVDWGGGGQYTGMPLRIIEELFRLHGNGTLLSDTAWDVLLRCIGWTNAFPYFPQEIFGQYYATPLIEMPLEIANAGGLQAIIFGLFGLQPDGIGRQLRIAPSWHPFLSPGVRLDGFRFLGHSFAILLRSDQFQVWQDGKVVGISRYDVPIVVNL